MNTRELEVSLFHVESACKRESHEIRQMKGGDVKYYRRNSGKKNGDGRTTTSDTKCY